MMGQVAESIFSGKTVVIPFAEVMFIERDLRDKSKYGISIIFNGTTWNTVGDHWNNIAYLKEEEAKSFMAAWCRYRSEIESETIAEIFPGTREALDDLGKA